MYFAGVYCCLGTTAALYPELLMTSTTQWTSLDKPWMTFLCAGGITPCGPSKHYPGYSSGFSTPWGGQEDEQGTSVCPLKMNCWTQHRCSWRRGNLEFSLCRSQTCPSGPGPGFSYAKLSWLNSIPLHSIQLNSISPLLPGELSVISRFALGMSPLQNHSVRCETEPSKPPNLQC